MFLGKAKESRDGRKKGLLFSAIKGIIPAIMLVKVQGDGSVRKYRGQALRG